MFNPLPGNEAYDVIPCEWPAGWWTVTCTGIPVYHFAPARRNLAERYATDPDYRLSQITQKVWEKNAR